MFVIGGRGFVFAGVCWRVFVLVRRFCVGVGWLLFVWFDVVVVGGYYFVLWLFFPRLS